MCINEFSIFFFSIFFNPINLSTIAFASLLQVNFLDLTVYSICAASEDGASNNQQNFLPVSFRYQNSMSADRQRIPCICQGFYEAFDKGRRIWNVTNQFPFLLNPFFRMIKMIKNGYRRTKSVKWWSRFSEAIVKATSPIQLLLRIQNVDTQHLLKFSSLWRMLNWHLKVTGKFKQAQPVAAAYLFILQYKSVRLEDIASGFSGWNPSSPKQISSQQLRRKIFTLRIQVAFLELLRPLSPCASSSLHWFHDV